jgi:ABC-type sulfate/molybdate transport systems ATPase subunit
VDSPRNLYTRPRTSYVATFIGKANVLSSGIAVRPENVQVLARTATVPDGSQCWNGIVRQTIFAGASEVLEIEIGEGVVLRARVPAGRSYPAEVQVAIAEEHLIRVA